MIKTAFGLLLLTLFGAANGTAQWTQPSSRITPVCRALCSVDGAIIAATVDSNIVRSIDQGMTWMRSGDGISDSLYIATLFGEGSRVFLGSTKGGYASTNGGQSWWKMNAGPADSQFIHGFCRMGLYLFMGSDSGVYRSLDNGQNWQRVIVGMPISPNVRCLGTNDKYLYVGTEDHSVYRSTDAGDHWVISGTGMDPRDRVSSLWTKGAVVIGFDAGGGYFRSTDYGDTWQHHSEKFTNTTSIGLCALDVDNALIVGADRGVIRSFDQGASWEEINTGFILPIAIQSLSIDKDYVYVGTINRWVWRRPLIEILPPSDVDASIAPYALRLNQSTPNPAASAAEISYALPAYTSVNLKLYNAMMQEVSTLVDEPQEAGEHHATLDASALPSGVYYYRLSAGTSSLTRRMLIVK